MNDLPMAIQAVPAGPGPVSGRFYVDFEIRVEEDRQATLAAGHFVGKDVDFAIITLPGGRDVRRRPVTEQLLNEWRHGTWRGSAQIKPPAPWAINAYERWKSGQEIPEHGWALRHWNALSPAQLKTCIAANVRTVDDLAALNDDGVKRLGIGGLQLVRLAREALKQKDGQRDTHRVVSLEQQVEQLQRQVAEVVAVNADLKRLLDAKGNGVDVSIDRGPLVPEGFTSVSQQPDERDALIAEGERLGVKLDRRMKPETMRERIREAQGQ